MNSSLPLVDVFLWLRWIAAGALIVWLPGYLLAGRSLRRLDATSRTAISIGVGLLGAALFGQVYAILGVPLTPWTYAVPALSLALLGGSRPALHRTFDGWIEDLAPLNTSAQILVLFGSSVMGTLVILGFGNLPAPHSIHDAANHAFIVARVV